MARPSNTVSELNRTVLSDSRRYTGNLTFAGPMELTGKITMDPSFQLGDAAPTEFGVTRHEGSDSVGDEAIRCEFGIVKSKGLYYVHSVKWPESNKSVIPFKPAPAELLADPSESRTSGWRLRNKIPPRNKWRSQ